MSTTSRKKKRKQAQEKTAQRVAEAVEKSRWAHLTPKKYFDLLAKAKETCKMLSELLYSPSANAEEMCEQLRDLGSEITRGPEKVIYCNGLDYSNKYGYIEFVDPNLEGIEFGLAVCQNGGNDPDKEGHAHLYDNVQLELFRYIRPLLAFR